MTYISQFKLRHTAKQLRQGHIIAYPTEAVYGLGCDPLNKKAVIHLLEIKQRPIDKGLILIASSFQQIEPYIEINDSIMNRIGNSWPGPVTWVIPARPWVPNWLTGSYDTLAVRVTAHSIAKRICQEFGRPVVSTSANPGGKQPARSLLLVKKNLPLQDIFGVKGELGGLNKTTPICSAVTEQYFRHHPEKSTSSS